MSGDETHSLGYEAVDGDPNVEVLLETMDATAAWPATQELRAWERRQLGLTAGQRLLDVGCGLGDAALVLAQALGAGGRVVGVDASTEMIAGARARARGSACPARFSTGDATELAEGDGTFDAVRSERCLQWLTEPGAAVREMTRVVRPGGRVSLLDSDWSTFALDIGDERLASMVRSAMAVERRRAWNVGGRLTELVAESGLDTVASTSAIQRWDDWDPDRSRAPLGCFSMASLADDLVDAGQLSANERRDFVETVEGAARAGCFSMSLTMSGVVAIRPDPCEFAPTPQIGSRRVLGAIAPPSLCNSSASGHVCPMQIFDMLEEFDEALDWGALNDPLLADHLPARTLASGTSGGRTPACAPGSTTGPAHRDA